MDVLELIPRHPISGGDDNGTIDYVSFSELFTPYTISTYASRCRDVNCTLLMSDMPTGMDIVLFDRTRDRLRDLAEEAAICGTRLLVDAEHCKYQPAIDHLVLELQRKYNAGDWPVVFNTYQVSVFYLSYLVENHIRLTMFFTREGKRSPRFVVQLIVVLSKGCHG
jgi:hypothetical protein